MERLNLSKQKLKHSIPILLKLYFCTRMSLSKVRKICHIVQQKNEDKLGKYITADIYIHHYVEKSSTNIVKLFAHSY